MIYYLMGKSAAGKDTVYARLLENDQIKLQRMVLYTTRPIRAGEENGREYFFVPEEQLREFRKSGKIIELREYQTVHGVWTYFTVDDGQVEPGKGDYLGIGTLESYKKLRDYYGGDQVCPLYLELEDGERLERALARERRQQNPKYEELCRRFLADQEDFSEEHILQAQIWRRFSTENMEECIGEILRYIRSMQ